MEFLNDMAYWHWLVFGLVLIVLEMFVPAAIFLWPGIAAMIVGAVALALPVLGWPALLVIWSVLSVALAFGWKIYRKNNPAKAEIPSINRRGEQYVGRPFTLAKDILNGIGELHVDDTRWRIACEHDLPAGAKVKVIAVEGTSLRVEEYIS